MHGLEIRGAAVNRGRFHTPGRFGRMFPHLRSLREFKPGPVELGKKGGPMDGGATAPDDQLNQKLSTGFTFLGQFLDHDVTFDPTSSLERQNDPEATRNFRTPAFELDSLYGAGPGAQPYLYDPDVPGALAIAKRGSDGDTWDDLPRTAGSTQNPNRPRQTAIIGDPRNDENLIVSQLHLAFIKFHNAVLAKELQGAPSQGKFEEAQRIVRWHYQWIVLHEFLPLTCGPKVVTDVLENGRRFFHFDDEAFMPVEFSVAAYRFGHSQVRPGYPINATGGAGIFPPSAGNPPGRTLHGNRNLPKELVIEWERFFGPTAARGMKIDTKLATPLLDLPDTVVPKQPKTDPATGLPILNAENADADVAVRSLAVRNLQRGIAFNLPSGQAVAQCMASAGIEPLTDSEIWQGVNGGEGPAPLWYYVLREAEVQAKAESLAGVGARIVAEVFVGLLQGDRASFINHDPGWKPHLGQDGKFTMVDLLTYAGLLKS